MKIYLAAVTPSSHLRFLKQVLFSFYDLTIAKVPFRRETFNTYKNESRQETFTTCPGSSPTRIS
jgi:hypothetical protein